MYAVKMGPAWFTVCSRTLWFLYSAKYKSWKEEHFSKGVEAVQKGDFTVWRAVLHSNRHYTIMLVGKLLEVDRVVLRDTFEEELEEFPATLGKFLGWCKRR
jgi:hypothetical protein